MHFCSGATTRVVSKYGWVSTSDPGYQESKGITSDEPPVCTAASAFAHSCHQAEPRLVRGLVGVKAWTVQCGHQHSGAIGLATDAGCRSSSPACWASGCHARLHGEQLKTSFCALRAAAIDKEGQAYLWGSNRFSQVQFEVFAGVIMLPASAESGNLSG
jgi:hypothetical protein